MKRALLALLGVVGAVGALYWVSVSQAAFSCEACVDASGQRFCQTVRAATEETSHENARANVCNATRGDLTQRLACRNAPSTTVVCGRP